jgi:enoyl-CoA hydratase
MPKGLFHFLRVGSEKPLIAAIEGFALAGGLEIALVCDLLVAARDATLGVPETKVGLFPGGGALLRLPQQLPHGVVVEMALTGSPISAELAYRYGLVTRLTGPNEASDSAIDLAESIAGNAPLGVRASKQVIRRSKGLTEEEFWEMQNPFSQSVFSSQDSKEGASAFAERREPRWTGT